MFAAIYICKTPKERYKSVNFVKNKKSTIALQTVN